MENSPRVLLILFEGLPGTVIESQVLVHAKEMARLGIAAFEIWTFAWSGDLYRQSVAAQHRAQALAGCPVRLFRGVRPAVPFSSWINAFIFWRGLRRFRPTFEIVHARTDYAVLVSRLLRPWYRFLLVWDCRGDSPAEFADRYQPRNPILRMLRAVRYRMLQLDWRRAAEACDRAIFVSETLEAIASPDMKGKPRSVIPCTASEALFHFDPSLRNTTRRDLGFEPEDRIFIFSGSLAPYQCFGETLSLFAEIHAEDARARLLIVTPEQDEARRRLARHLTLEGVVFRSATIDEMIRYLNAADVAFMLREATATNRAAFPTKFAEYCLAGLAVIMTTAVPDAYGMAERLGNLLPAPRRGILEWPPEYDRRRVAAAAKSSLTRTSVASKYAEIYTCAINCLGKIK